MDKTDKTLSDAQLIERTIDFAGDLQKQVYDLQTALSESQKHLADANRGAQRQSGVNQLLVKELVQMKNALSDSQKECERLKTSPVEGLEVVRKCNNMAFHGEDGEPGCHWCNDTGEIVRPLTRGETEEIAKHYLKKNYHIMIDKDGIKCNVRVKR